MATGYTSKIGEGQTFEEFFWGCARAFGSFIMQRDDPSDAPPVLDEQMSDYYPKALADAILESSRLAFLSEKQWQKDWKAYKAESTKSHNEQETKLATLTDRYVAMLSKVHSWKPPTPDHVGMKSFMIQQIEDSIKWDCTLSPLELMPFDEWKQAKLDSARHDVEYYQKNLKEERERVDARNKWKADLLASVPLPVRTEK